MGSQKSKHKVNCSKLGNVRAFLLHVLVADNYFRQLLSLRNNEKAKSSSSIIQILFDLWCFSPVAGNTLGKTFFFLLWEYRGKGGVLGL